MYQRNFYICQQGAAVFSTCVEPNSSLSRSFPSTQPFMNSNDVRDSQQVTSCSRAEPCHGFRQPVLAQPSPIMRRTSSASLAKEHQMKSDLQGLVLTLGGPASGNHA